MSDPFSTPEGMKWVRRVLTGMAPKLRASAVSLNIIPDGEGDPKFWVELGAAIMMDKPIIALCRSGREVPAKLRVVADEIVEVPGDIGSPAAADTIARAVERVMRGRDVDR